MKITKRERWVVLTTFLVLMSVCTAFFLIGRHRNADWCEMQFWSIIAAIGVFVVTALIFIGDQVARRPCQRFYRGRCDQIVDGSCVKCHQKNLPAFSKRV